VRNIKTLSKLSESNEMSIIKKNGDSNTINGENELIDGLNGNYIPHSVGLRIKTINPNEFDLENN
jgi:hypothetical protein